ncbi:MAG: ABC transporter permease [Muribaculaceae bacterium]|nr:ABC transporter permease [Muribaculaceae bacterium]
MLSFIKKYTLQLFKVYCREFKLILGDVGIMLFLIFLPIGYPIIYSLIYNPELVRDVKMVVVDHDRTSLSRELTRNIDATQEAWVIGYASDMAEARRAMDSHKCYAIMEIPEGFERKVREGDQANAMLFCESSLLLRYRGFLMASTNVAQAMGAEILNEKINEIAPLATTITDGDLMPVMNVPMGNIESGFDSFIMPGVLILILQQCIILATGMAGGAKRERPSLIGYDGVNEQPSVLMTMLGQMLCYITILLVPIIYLIHYVPLMFAFPMAGNFVEIITFLTPMIIASAAMGFCLQGIVWERESVFVLWVVTSVVFLFLSGLTWPRYAMSPFWTFVSDAVPATWGVEGFIRMNSNGASLAQEAHDFKMLWLLAAIYSVAAYYIQRWVVRPSIVKGYNVYSKVRREEI